MMYTRMCVCIIGIFKCKQKGKRKRKRDIMKEAYVRDGKNCKATYMQYYYFILAQL